jgi:hypothetical protein
VAGFCFFVLFEIKLAFLQPKHPGFHCKQQPLHPGIVDSRHIREETNGRGASTSQGENCQTTVVQKCFQGIATTKARKKRLARFENRPGLRLSKRSRTRGFHLHFNIG